MPDLFSEQAAARRLGDTVRELRHIRGWTQKEYAARAGVHHGYVSHLECGRKTPSLKILLVLAAPFDATPSELLAEARL